MKTALEIAHDAKLRPITEIAKNAGILPEELEQFGDVRGKVKLSILDRLAKSKNGKVVIVTAITPTKAGEGKTTTSVSLTQGLGQIKKNVMLCLREPSMGPVFGVKGGGTGGGYAQIAPMEEINLHFNGDFHAVTAAHSLLAAALDASIYNGNPLRIDPASIIWPRTVDMNDRELRYSVIGLGGKTHGIPRENEFVITAASEIMAIFALASDIKDLRQRLGRIVVASTYDGEPVTAEMLRCAGAMTVIMKDAIKPNLVQTLEGQPALVHAGPFGNIAHANNSILADRIAIKLADYIVTEAGFASDLGMQKFCDIVCRTGGFAPSAAVLVTTVRATKSHGGKPFNLLAQEDLDAIRKGADNLAAHIQIVRQYGLPCVVAINSFPTDTANEIALVKELAIKAGAETVVPHNGFGQGGAGAVELATAVVAACDKPNTFDFLTPNGTPIVQQIEAIATRLYGAAGIDLQMQAQKDLAKLEKLGMSTAPVCMAKTQMSLSHDPALRNRPTGFVLPVRALLPSAGAGFVIALCGDMQRMPGLGKTPAFQNIDIDATGQTIGLF
jgi:formate--tetrahydrofolate ligase